MSEATRPMDTTLLFPMIRSAVTSGKCQMIDNKRCFVISESAFLNIMSYFFASGRDFTCDPRIAPREMRTRRPPFAATRSSANSRSLASRF